MPFSPCPRRAVPLPRCAPRACLRFAKHGDGIAAPARMAATTATPYRLLRWLGRAGFARNRHFALPCGFMAGTEPTLRTWQHTRDFGGNGNHTTVAPAPPRWHGVVRLWFARTPRRPCRYTHGTFWEFFSGLYINGAFGAFAFELTPHTYPHPVSLLLSSLLYSDPVALYPTCMALHPCHPTWFPTPLCP